MNIGVLELNDTGLTLAREQAVVTEQPGYVARVGGQLIIGQEAVAVARANPQSVSHRYWDTLDQQTLPSEGSWQETPAELAYAQLVDLWSTHGSGTDGAMLVVPASFTRTQLGLILGMCRKAQINVLSLIDSAIAALESPPAATQIIVVDLTLHRVIATRVQVDAQLARAAVAELDQLGLADFRRKWMAAIGDQCVRATRYDPMHSAAAEQALYDELPALLTALTDADTADMPVAIGAQTHHVTISKAALAQVCSDLCGQVDGLINELVDPALGSASIVLTHRFAQCPGVAQMLAAAHGGATLLPDHAAVLGVARHLEQFRQDADAVGLITQRPLPAGSVPATASAVVARPRVQPATHILVDNRIYLINAEPFVVGTATAQDRWGYRAVGAVKGVSRRHCSVLQDGARTVVRDHSTYGTYVNGQRVDGELTVGDGDVIRVGNPGVELRLVREASLDG